MRTVPEMRAIHSTSGSVSGGVQAFLIVLSCLLPTVACSCTTADDPHSRPVPSAGSALERSDVPNARRAADMGSSAPRMAGSAAPASSLLAAPAPPVEATNEGTSQCVDFCTHTAPLHCGPREACQLACASLFQVEACRVSAQAFLRCGEEEPVAHWECVEGLPAIRDGYCDAEQAGVFKCVQAVDQAR